MLLPVEPLSALEFAPFGDVIEAPADTSGGLSINDGTAIRYDDLSRLDTNSEQGHAALSLFVASARKLPVSLTEFERHPLGSQAFVPLDGEPYLVAVTPEATPGSASLVRVFLARANQGINLRKGVWHHPLLALNKSCLFLVADRVGPGNNLQVQAVSQYGWQVSV